MFSWLFKTVIPGLIRDCSEQGLRGRGEKAEESRGMVKASPQLSGSTLSARGEGGWETEAVNHWGRTQIFGRQSVPLRRVHFRNCGHNQNVFMSSHHKLTHCLFVFQPHSSEIANSRADQPKSITNRGTLWLVTGVAELCRKLRVQSHRFQSFIDYLFNRVKVKRKGNGQKMLTWDGGAGKDPL